jgi:hypothetical protein
VSLTLEVDVEEPRVVEERLVAAMEGRTLDELASTDSVWADPVTDTVFLRPYRAREEFSYTTSGNYARLAKTDYTLTTSANWIENHVEAPGDIFLESLGTNEIVTTTASYAANRAFYIDGFIFGKKTNLQSVLECGWGDPATGVSIRLRANSDFEVWKGGTRLGFYSPPSGGAMFQKAKKGKRGQAASMAGQFFSLLLIPCRLRELLVVIGGGAGTGFSHVFDDLDPVAGNTITPSGHFWWYVPPRPDAAYQKACIQCAPIKWATSGTARGQAVGLRKPPITGATFTSKTGGAVPSGCGLTASLVRADTLAAFVPNGVLKDVRVNVAMTGTGDYSPEIYSSDLYTDPTVAMTTDGTFDLAPYTTALSLTAPERGATTINIDGKGPGAMEADGLDRPRKLQRRTVRLALRDIDIFRGTLGLPEVDEGAGMAPCDWDTIIRWKGEDRTTQFTRRKFLHTIAYDGMTLSSAMADLAATAGFGSSDVDITVDSFPLPFSPAVSSGDWQLLPRLGESVRTWQERLHADFAATWIEGWSPTLTGLKWRFRRPDTYSSTPSLEMYQSHEDAALAGVLPAVVPRRVVTGLRERALPSEANRVLVVGYDRRTEQEIYSLADDAAAQDPTIAIASRPEHWSGETDSYFLIDGDGINDQDTADRSRDIVAERIIPNLPRWELDCQWLIRETDDRSLWKGDVIRVYDPSDGETTSEEYADLRIIAIPQARFEAEDDDDDALSWRPTTYLVEVIDTSTGCVTFTPKESPTLVTVP